MFDAASAAPTATTVAAVIGAAGSVIAASIATWAVLRAQSYRQLLADISKIVKQALHEELDAQERGPIIAGHVLRAIGDTLDTHSHSRRRWYDR